MSKKVIGFKVYAHLEDGSYVELSKAEVKPEEERKQSSTGKTRTVAYAKANGFTFEGERAYCQLTVGQYSPQGEQVDLAL